MNAVDRVLLKAKRQVLREENARYGASLQPVEASEWPEVPALVSWQKPIAVWRSRDFLAVQYRERRITTATRLSVCRTQMRDDGRMVDGITWDELQRIKRECGFGDVEAVEIYPRDCDIVNVSNMRHLWLLSQPCEFTWRVPG